MIKKIKIILNDKKYIIHLIKYVFFGVLATIVSLGSFWLIRRYLPQIEENIANAISIILAIIFAYFTNRIYVFKSKEKNMLKEFIAFASSRGFTFAFDMATFFIFASVLHFNEMIVKIIIQIAVIILNYIISKVLVFKEVKEDE
jgi:putative flippase GtrA